MTSSDVPILDLIHTIRLKSPKNQYFYLFSASQYDHHIYKSIWCKHVQIEKKKNVLRIYQL